VPRQGHLVAAIPIIWFLPSISVRLPSLAKFVYCWWHIR